MSESGSVEAREWDKGPRPEETSESVPQQGIVDGDPRPVLSTEPLDAGEEQRIREWTAHHTEPFHFPVQDFRRLLATLDAERTASAALRAKAEKVIDNAEPDENWEGEFVDWIVPHDDMLDLRAALTSEAHRG